MGGVPRRGPWGKVVSPYQYATKSTDSMPNNYINVINMFYSILQVDCYSFNASPSALPQSVVYIIVYS